MATNHDNFHSWYTSVLIKLFPDRDAGFVILMAVFPLLERYLRHKSGLTSRDDLTDGFMDSLRALFPELPDRSVCRHFWQVYRNGLLHEVTLSRESRHGTPMPVGWISHDRPIVSIDPDTSLWVNPVLFAQRVLSTIDADFATFEGPPSGRSKLPTVVAHVEPTVRGSVPSVLLGTRTGP